MPKGEKTSAKVASTAGKQLANPKTPKPVKTVAASALTQAAKSGLIAILAMTIVAASTGLVLAVERMSDEEVAVRERHDQAIAERAACFERHNIDPFEKTADVCLAEQEKARQISDEFNEFMLEKQQAVPFQERRRQYNVFKEQYSIHPVEELQDLHRKNCITKWGGHDSTECQAIASQISMKKEERLRQEYQPTPKAER